MDPSQPPVTCHYCGDPVDPSTVLTLQIRQGDREGGWAVEDVAAFHPPCWEAFQREHGLT